VDRIDVSTRQKALCQNIVKHMEPGAKWAMYGNLGPAYIFYTRTYPKNVYTEKELTEFLSSKERVYCLISEEKLRELKLPIIEVAKLKGPSEDNTVFILVSNQPIGG